MYRVLVGGISPEGEHLLTSYLERFVPDYQIEPLKAAGIKGKMKNHVTKVDVVLAILDDMLWDACVGVVDSVLELPKVHHYESDDGLQEFLTERFGPLSESETGTIPPDMLMAQQDEEDEYIPKSADLSKDSSDSATVPPDSLMEPVMVDDELPTTEESEDVKATDAQSEVVEKLETKVRDLQSTIAGKETLIRSLTQQLQERKADDQDDIAAMVGRIRELEEQIAAKDAQLSNSDQSNFVNLGKVARAEQVLEEFEGLREQIKTLSDGRASLEGERDNLVKKLEAMNGEVTELKSQVAELDALRQDIDAKASRLGVLEQQIADQEAIVADLKSEKAELEAASADAAGVASELAQLRSEAEVMQQQIDTDREKLARLDDAEDELSAKQLTIENLNADIRALNDKLDTQHADIEQLREDLKKKSSELDALQKTLEGVKDELRKKTEALEEAEKARDDALANVSNSSEYSQTLLESTQSLSQRITELTDEVNQKNERLDAVMEQLQEAQSSIDSLNQQLEDSGVVIQSKTEEIDKLSEKLSETESALSDKNSDYDSIAQELSATQGDLESVRADLEGAKSDLSAKTEECNGLSERLQSTQSELTDKVAECNGLGAKLEELKRLFSSSMDEVRSQLVAKDDEITDLRGKLTTKESTVTKLTSDIADLHEQLASANGEVTQTREQLAAVRKQLLDAQSAGNEAAISAETQKQALEKLLGEKGELEDKLVAAESHALELETRIRGLEEDLTQERAYRGSVDESNVELTAQNEKFSNTIKQLEESLVRAKADEDMVSRLEQDLLEERRRSARLQSEVDVLKKTSGSEKASDIRLEVVRLKKELTDLQSSTVSAAEAERVKAELTEARARNAQLELDIVSKEQEARAASSSVFAQLQNIAIPKSVYDFRFGGVAPVSDKFVCMVSGSEESTANVYQVLRSACVADQNRKVLIIDLVTDSSIDREFGIKKVVSPIDWLSGKAQFKQYLAETRFGHVKVLSTALAYINDLFLLTVDWESRFAELDAFSADKVVLYIGCLNNLVTKVLFDMFSKAMKTFVVVKATPVNLRTTILNLTGFKDLSPAVTVECVNFSDSSSAGMYQRLTQKYKAQILRDTEVLQL